MAATLQSQAVQVANGMISVAQNLAAVKDQIDLLSAQYTQLTLGTVFSGMATTVVNTDGSLGTADGSPNIAHVIDPRVIGALTRAISSNDIGSLLTALQAISTLLAGGAASQQGQFPQLLAKVVGG